MKREGRWLEEVPRKLYVHVGPRKTATSAIQQMLLDHGNSAVCYPRVGLGGPANYRGHHALVFSHFGESRRSGYSKVDPSELFGAVRDEVREDNRNILISSEL